MKKFLFVFLFSCLVWNLAFGQVGVNTTTPDAMLDISPSDATNPAPTDGILIPRIDAFPVTNPTAAQDGMLVFLTGAGIPQKGFYYWNQSTTAWVPLASGQTQDADWFRTETTEVSTSITDSIFTFGNVAIGKNTANASIDILNQNNQQAVAVLSDGTNDQNITSYFSDISNTGEGNHFGLNNLFSGIGSGNRIGAFNRFAAGSGNQVGKWSVFSEASGNEFQLGMYNDYHAGGDDILAGSFTEVRETVVGDGQHYGAYHRNSSPGSGPHYGYRTVFNDVGNGFRTGNITTISSTGDGNHYGVRNILSGAGSGFHTGMLTQFTAGAGILTGQWNEFSGDIGNGNQIGTYNSYFAGGDGVLAGSYTDIRSTVTGNGPQYGTFSSNSSPGTGPHYGIRSILNDVSTGERTGVSTTISNSGDGDHFGVNTRLSGAGSGFHTGMMTRFTAGTGILTGQWNEFSGNIGNGNQIGAYNSYFAGGDGVLAGSYTEIRSTVVGNGPQYGTFSSNSSPGTGPHYGIRSILNDVATGERTGVSTIISNTGNGDHYGMDIQLSGTGSGFHTGVIARFSSGTGNLTGQWNEFSGNIGNGNQIGAYNSYFAGGNGLLAGSYTEIRSTVAGNGSQYGTYLTNSSIGSGNKYGVFTNINTAAGGTHYGVYSSATNANGWSGYFLGRMYVSQNVGIRINEPTFNIHLKQSSNTAAGEGGVGLENATNTNNWKIYNSGLYLSFAENGVRRAYVTNGTGAYVETSDRRLKKHIIPTNDVLSELLNLRVNKYLYISQDDSAKKTIGFMAQDVQPMFPELVEIDEDGYFGLNYSGFGVIAIKAIQEQQILIERLEKRIEELEQKLK